jgi:hypothetical protein
MPDSHILCYLIPSESGNTEAGQRRLNWVWYWNTSEKELVPLLTDAEGIRRAYAIPPGSLHPEQEHKQRTIAESVLPPAFKALLRATKEPFVQAIMDLACPRLVLTGPSWLAMPPSSSVLTQRRAPRKGSQMPSP